MMIYLCTYNSMSCCNYYDTYKEKNECTINNQYKH